MTLILQANLNRSMTANNRIYQVAQEKNADLLLLSEPYKNKNSPLWFSDPHGTAAIRILKPDKIPVDSHGNCQGFVWIKSGKITYISCYLTPYGFREEIDSLKEVVLNTTDDDILVAGHFDAKAVEWGIPHQNWKNNYLMEMKAKTGLHVLNNYMETTSDISLANNVLLPRIKDHTNSDHQYIILKVNKKSYRFNMDKTIFISEISRKIEVTEGLETTEKGETEELVENTIRHIVRAYESAIQSRHDNADWWTQNFAKLIQDIDPTTLENVLDNLFPKHFTREKIQFDHVKDCTDFSAEELKKAVENLKIDKIPGPDGISEKVLQLVVKHNPNLLLKAYNACLKTGVFPLQWRTAYLVLFDKGKGDPGLPSSYRPVCFFDAASKLLERLIRTKLQLAIEAAGDLSPMQYGYRKGRLTSDVIQKITTVVRQAEDHESPPIVLLVKLDVRNAFNSVRWRDVMFALKDTFKVPRYLLRILDDYLSDRKLIYKTGDGQKTMKVTSGLPQGSVLGPDLWNIVYDSLFRTNMPEGTLLVGYADDIAVLITARNVRLAQEKLKEVMCTINNWMAVHSLSLALEKTEIVNLTRKRIDTILSLQVGHYTVKIKPAVKFIGFMIDCKLSFWAHIQQIAGKAAEELTSPSRLIMEKVISKLSFGAEVWADSLDEKAKCLAQVQRKAALKIAFAYPTVSESAILVIANIIPVALMAKERKAVSLRKTVVGLKVAKQEERENTFQSWQTSWDHDSEGLWTAKLIKKVRTWAERKYGKIDYYLTQFLSGHGYFRAYQYMIGQEMTNECWYCPGMIDDVEHTFFNCKHWAKRKRDLETRIGQVTPDNVVEKMLRRKERWDQITTWVHDILRTKELELYSI